MSAGALLRCSGCGVRRWVHFGTDGSGHHVEDAAPCKCTPAPRAQPIPIMAKPPHAPLDLQTKIREYVDRRRAFDHTLQWGAVAEEVEKKFGVRISEATFKRHYWSGAAEGESEAPATNGNGAAAPVNRIADLVEEKAEPAPIPSPVAHLDRPRAVIGAVEVEILRFVGVPEEQIERARALAAFINALER